MALAPEQIAQKKALLMRKRELLLMKARGDLQETPLEKSDAFLEEQFPEIVEEVQGKTGGLIPPAMSQVGAQAVEKAPAPLKTGLEFAAETAKGQALGPGFGGGIAKSLIEKPGLTSRTAALAFPATRAPEAVGTGLRLLTQQFFPAKDVPAAGITAEVVGGLAYGAGRSVLRNIKNAVLSGNRQQILGVVDDALGDANKIKNTLRDDITTVMDSPIGDKTIDIAKTSKALSGVQPNVQKKILSQADIFNIELLPDGSIKPTVKNTWRLRQALDDFLTSKDYIEATKAVKKSILNARRGVAKILNASDPEVGKAMKSFSDFMDKFEPVKRVFADKTGKAIANKAISAFKKSGEPATRNALEEFGKQSEATRKAIEKIQRFVKGEGAKTSLKRAGLGLLGGITAGGVGGGILGKVLGRGKSE